MWLAGARELGGIGVRELNTGQGRSACCVVVFGRRPFNRL